MKHLSYRRAAAALAAAAVTLLCSCGADTAAPERTGFPVTARCTLTLSDGADAGFTLEMARAYEGTLTFTDGDLCGAVIRVDGEGVRICTDGFEAGLDCPAGAPVRAVVDAFSLPGSDILESSREGGVSSLTALCADGTVRARYSPDGVRFDFENGCGAYTVTAAQIVE